MKIHNTKYKIVLFLIFTVFPNSFAQQNTEFNKLADKINKISNFQKTKGLDLLDSLYKMAYNSPDSSLLIARCLYEDATLKQRHGIIDTLLIRKIKEQLAKESQMLQVQSLLQLALSNYYLNEGKYSDAFFIFHKELEKFKQLQDNSYIVRTLNGLGLICSRINLHNLAEYYYLEADKYNKPEFPDYFLIKFNKFNSPYYEDVAIDSLLNLVEFAKNEKYTEIIPLLYLSLGRFYLLSEPEKAFMYFDEIQFMYFDAPIFKSLQYAFIGFHYFNNSDFSEALRYYKDAQIIMEEGTDFLNLKALYNGISIIYGNLNMYDSAFIYSQKSEDLSQKIHSNLIAIETHQQNITTMYEASLKDLNIAEQKNDMKNRQLANVLIISISAIMLILLFLLLVQKQKRRKTKELTDEIKSKEIEKQNQKKLLDAKKREITSYSALVTNKNQLLKQIKDLNTQEHNNNIITKIDDIIRDNLNIDKEWDNFKLHFDKVHPDFFEKLKQQNNHLTEENLKLCAYIKMRLSSKQIAQLLNIGYRSVVTARNRLKNKLHLSEDEDLDDFIGSL